MRQTCHRHPSNTITPTQKHVLSIDASLLCANLLTAHVPTSQWDEWLISLDNCNARFESMLLLHSDGIVQGFGKASKDLHDVAKYINERAESLKAQTEVVTLQREFFNGKYHIVSPTREFVMKGVLKKVCMSFLFCRLRPLSPFFLLVLFC